MSERVYKVISKTINLENYSDKIKIWLFGDIHRFTKSCDVERWKKFLSDSRKEHDKNTYYLGLGDYDDFASTTEQKVIKSELHAQTLVDFGDIVKKRNRALAMEMSHMKGQILGLIDGNHGWKFEDGTTGTEDLANRLGTEFLGWLCHFTLRILTPRGQAANVHIIACHGKSGGGKTAGLTINQVDDLKNVFPVADIYVLGHDHQRAARPVSILIPASNNNGEIFIKQKRQFLCRSGSFKKAYIADTSSYEVGKLLRPSDLGALLIEISLHRDCKDGDRTVVDMKAIV